MLNRIVASSADSRKSGTALQSGTLASNSPIIEVSGVSKRFSRSDNPAVSNLSFSINAGETLAILGPSGSGKTTTLRMIAGFEDPDAGEIRIGNKKVASPGFSVPTEKRGIGMVFQQFALFPHLTVEQNVAYGLAVPDASEKSQRVNDALRLVGMEGYGKRYPQQLSGGQQQRVALARALAPQPIVLLMDEPFGSLDMSMRATMRREVKSILHQTNTTTILVTHDKDEAFALADKILLMNDGKLHQFGSPENVYHNPADRFVAEFVGTANFIPAKFENGKIVTELGSFTFTGDVPGREFDLLLRPDDIQIESDARGNNSVLRREFKGADNLYQIQLASGRTLWTNGSSFPALDNGEKVSLKLTLAHVVLYPKG